MSLSSAFERKEKKYCKEKIAIECFEITHIGGNNIRNESVRSFTVGSTLSLALSETKSANGTIHRHSVKYPSTYNVIIIDKSLKHIK